MTKEQQESKTPWKNGHYRSRAMPNDTFEVEGESVTMQDPSSRASNVKIVDERSKGSWKYGDFGETHSEVAEETGKATNDVEIILVGGYFTFYGVLDDSGDKITYRNMHGLDTFEWMTEEEYDLKCKYGDPAEAPSSYYKIQPENQGRFIFITGAPGFGKSTIGNMLSKTEGYVHYEGDCFDAGVNPYIPHDVTEPSLATVKQKPLLGMPQERIEAMITGGRHFMEMLRGDEYDEEMVGKYYSAMCRDIAGERKRLGGDWVVTHAVPSRYFRDLIRAELGPDVLFVVLNMSREDQRERLVKRHGQENESFNDLLSKMFDLYEPAGDDEENAVDLLITNQMTREDVVKKLLKMLE